MARLDRLIWPIPEESLKALEPELCNLQGNILSSHGRDRSIHIFLQFGDDKERAKAWIGTIAERITSAQEQLAQAAIYDHGNGDSGGLFCCFFLSAHGYVALGIETLPPDPAFIQGMASRQASAASLTYQSARNLLNDPRRNEWDPGYRGMDDGGEIDAMLLLADDAGDDGQAPRWDEQPLWEKQNLPREEQFRVFEELLRLQGVAQICAIEYGRVIRHPHTGQRYEHFGYVDGGSQPLFFVKDVLNSTLAIFRATG